MIVIFRTESYPDITMFGEAATKLLHMMGHSGTIPGAVGAEDIPAALEQLRAAVDALPAPPPDDDSDNEVGERPVGLAQRAFPLVEMLEAAVVSERPVMWDKG